ncbi:MAG: SDR family oxidoreductase [Candidatus Tectomicrobia bacterium]|uniref:SDR family oxidoreductase n=1 Tax=Tectimicrobiota bacterium TaxID=2528274 RepID=A0A932MML7_UNCTE|nr:SDR family oxidoreductase [Candidatus Tectomicrobia bacterium]
MILGSSSGFGGAVAARLAREGMNVFGVHLDRKATIPNAERVQEEIKRAGAQAVFFNTNAAGHGERAEVLAQMKAHLGAGAQGAVRVLLHSLAFGTLKPYISDDPAGALTPKQLEMTLDVMANSLVYWTQDLVREGLMGEGGRIFAMTSSGGHRVWPTYGAVSAAKAALESHIRQLAFELASKGISANSVQAGVTDTPALRKIPGNEEMLELAQRMNPHKRLTTPGVVADAIACFSRPGTRWMTGNVIRVDGGEDIAG